jgi:hypothetical protein
MNRRQSDAPLFRMKMRRVQLSCVLVFVLIFTGQEAWADAGVFTGNGQNLHQISSKEVRLLSIDVTIVLGRGPFLFDGGVPGMDRAEYLCTFVLQNLSEKTVKIQVGFPVDSEFANGAADDSGENAKQWVLNYGFIARDEKATYHVDFVRRKKKSPEEFAALFIWDMSFQPRETKMLSVKYQIPVSMGLVSLEKNEEHSRSQIGLHAPEFLNTAMLEMAGYITSTGSSWAGNVKTATFTVITKPFEQYLERRGISEESPKAKTPASFSPEVDQRVKEAFPVHHPWWFRKITPEGWKQVEGGIQWQYKDYKPKDPIDVRYYITQFPRLPDEVDAFVDRFLSSGASVKELEEVKQVLLSTYGKEPEDVMAKEFADTQLWYEPRKNFSMTDLTPNQEAVLAGLNARIEKEKRTGSAH